MFGSISSVKHFGSESVILIKTHLVFHDENVISNFVHSGPMRFLLKIIFSTNHETFVDVPAKEKSFFFNRIYIMLTNIFI